MVLVRGAWDGIWVLGGANWSKADPKLVAEHPKPEQRGLVGERSGGCSWATQLADAQDCKLCRNASLEVAEGGNAAASGEKLHGDREGRAGPGRGRQEGPGVPLAWQRCRDVDRTEQLFLPTLSQ